MRALANIRVLLGQPLYGYGFGVTDEAQWLKTNCRVNVACPSLPPLPLSSRIAHLFHWRRMPME